MTPEQQRRYHSGWTRTSAATAGTSGQGETTVYRTRLALDTEAYGQLNDVKAVLETALGQQVSASAIHRRAVLHYSRYLGNLVRRIKEADHFQAATEWEAELAALRSKKKCRQSQT